MPEAPKGILKKEPSIQFHAESSLSPLPDATTASRRKMKTPRRTSDGEESGFSDANPFQSGNESAQAEVRRRRKVCICCPMLVLAVGRAVATACICSSSWPV